MSYILSRPLSLLGAVLLVAMFAAPQTASAQLSNLQKMYVFGQLVPDIERVGVIAAASNGDDSSINRAVSSIGATLYIAEVESRREVAPAFRELTRTHNVESIWIVTEDEVVGQASARQFLIENTTRAGIPLLAPDASWVDEGATVSVVQTGDDIGLVVNEAVLQALSLTIPDDVMDSVQYASN